MAKPALWTLLVLVVVGEVKSAGHLRLYASTNFKDLIYDEDVDTYCTSLTSAGLNDNASSVDTDGTCVILYEDAFCKGQRIRLRRDYTTRTNLDHLDFDKKASSARACCPEIPGKMECCSKCPFPHAHGHQSFPFFLQTARLRIYDHADWDGLIYEMVATEECYNLYDVNDQASSVDTNGTCVVLYDEFDCKGPHIVVHPSVQSWASRWVLSEFKFDNVASSVRACCDQRNFTDVPPRDNFNT